MTTVTVYRSTDASAPVLTGQAGALVGVLDACLVNGYGAKAAAGWTIPFTATNKRNYKNSAVDGTGSTLYVDDTGSGGGGVQEALCTGFKTGTAIGAGTGQFPTIAQLGIGIGAVVVRKSNTADTTARPWTVVADDTCFYLFTQTGDFTSPVCVVPFMFGDIFSYATSDPYKAMIIGRNIEGQNNFYPDWFSSFSAGYSTNALTQTLCGHFMAASWTGVGGSILVGKHTDQFKMSTSGGQPTYSPTTPLSSAQATLWQMGCTTTGSVTPNYSFSYPNGPDGGLYVAPVWVHHNGSVRGYLKGLWSPLQVLPLNHNDTYSGSGTLAGKSFLVQAIPGGGNNGFVMAQCHIETSSTWS